MAHNTKAIRISLLNEQVEALSQLGKSKGLSLSQALIQYLQTTNLNVQNDNKESNPVNW